MRYNAIKIKGKKIDLHRHLVETSINRKLKSDEVVHNIDGNKLNNQLKS